jgi:glycosyltransferase involved in cell wall biosynthesis
VAVVKVCFITANYPPEANGGTEQVVAALARELASHSVEVAAISGSDERREDVGDDVREEQHEGVAITRLFRGRGERDQDGYERPRILALVRKSLTELQPDIVHVHSFAGLSLGISAICRELQIPVAVTFHDMWVTCARYFRLPMAGVTCPTNQDHAACVTCVHEGVNADVSFVQQAVDRRDELLREELAIASVCTAPSQTAAGFVRDCVPFSGTIEIVPHGLLRPVAREHAADAPKAGEPLRIGTFGGLVASKGLRELVQACVQVVQLGHVIELHLSGPWHELDLAVELRDLAKGAGLTLVEHGLYGHADRHPVRDLHLAVFPSKCQETYGLVVDEALAHRVPVVVSNFGALAERSTTPGVVVTALEELANVLVELVASPERLAALRSAIPAQLATIGASAQRHLDLYQTLR